MKGLRNYGRYGSVGIELLLSIGVGYYLGRFVDRKLGTHFIAFVGFLLGGYAGFRALFRAAKEMSRDAEIEDRMGRGEDLYAKDATKTEGENAGRTPMAKEADDTGAAAKAAAVLGAVFAVGALATHGPKASFSVAVGASIAVANLLTMRAIVRSLLTTDDADVPATEAKDAAGEGDGEAGEGPRGDAPDEARRKGKRGGAAWGIFAVAKIFVLFGGIWLLLTRGWVVPMALVVGYGVLPLGIASQAVWKSLRP